MAAVNLVNLNKVYRNGVKAIDNVNLEIWDKEFLVLVGPSGSGKSTILRMIAGLEEITGGEIFIGDTKANDVLPKDRDIAMVFQDYALYPNMNVFDNIAFGLKMRKVPKAEIQERVKATARTLSIEGLLPRKPKQISGGEKQRVALGRAIVRNPRIFLMDEPLSNLDAKLRVQMRIELIRLYRKLNTTVIYVTHDQTEAMTMGTRIVVLKDGVIQQVDTPREVYAHPANAFVASFIGTPPMNLLPGQLVVKEGRVLFRWPNGALHPLGRNGRLNEADFMEKDIILGIRPEHISIVPERPATGDDFTGEVEVVENMGADSYASIITPCGSLLARIPAETQLTQGERVFLNLTMDRLHLFDAGDGRRMAGKDFAHEKK
jgi:multiple sugar transport system ATP-binding protein